MAVLSRRFRKVMILGIFALFLGAAAISLLICGELFRKQSTVSSAWLRPTIPNSLDMCPVGTWSKATAVCDLNDLRWDWSNGSWFLHGLVTIRNKGDSVIWYFARDLSAFRLEVAPSDTPGENSSVVELDLSLDQFPDLVADSQELLALAPGDELQEAAVWRFRVITNENSMEYRLGAFSIVPGAEVRVRIADYPVMDAFAFKGDDSGEFVDFELLSGQPDTSFLVELISNWQYTRVPNDFSTGLVVPKIPGQERK